MPGEGLGPRDVASLHYFFPQSPAAISFFFRQTEDHRLPEDRRVAFAPLVIDAEEDRADSVRPDGIVGEVLTPFPSRGFKPLTPGERIRLGHGLAGIVEDIKTGQIMRVL